LIMFLLIIFLIDFCLIYDIIKENGEKYE